MTPIHNAALVFRKAWSIKLTLAGMLFALGSVVLPHFTQVIDPDTMVLLAAICSGGAAGVRLLKQTELDEVKNDA